MIDHSSIVGLDQRLGIPKEEFAQHAAQTYALPSFSCLACHHFGKIRQTVRREAYVTCNSCEDSSTREAGPDPQSLPKRWAAREKSIPISEPGLAVAMTTPSLHLLGGLWDGGGHVWNRPGCGGTAKCLIHHQFPGIQWLPTHQETPLAPSCQIPADQVRL